MSLPRRTPSSAAPAEWVGGIVSVPVSIVEQGETFQPGALLWLDPVSERILGIAFARPGELIGLAEEHLRETIEAPETGPPGPPARLRVATRTLAEALRHAFPAIEIVVAPTPEIDVAGANLIETMTAGAGDPGWIGDGLAVGAVGAFFDTMARLWRAAPWNAVPGDDALFHVTIEALEVHDAVALVTGRRSENAGVLLFHDVDGYERYVNGAYAMQPDDPRLSHPLDDDRSMPAHLGLSYDPAAHVSPVRLQECRAHRWTLAHEDAFPSLLVLEEGLAERAPERHEVRRAEALARVFARLVDNKALSTAFRTSWSTGEPIERTVTVRTHEGKVAVRLGAPVLLPSDGPRDPDTVPERVYRLKLELEHTDEEVTRTVELAGDHTLRDLHDVVQRAFDWDDDHLYSFFVSGKLHDRDSEYTGTPMGDLEPSWWDDGPVRSVQATRLDDLGLVRRRAMRYLFDQEHLVRIGVSSIRDGGPDDTGLPRTVDSTGEAPPQYEPCD